MTGRLRGPLPLPLLLLALALGVAPTQQARADRETAKPFHDRGDAALRAGDWEGAAEAFRKALAEEESHLPARYGLAEALLGAGDRPGGVEAFRAVAMAADRAGLPSAWVAFPTRAKKKLLEIDPIGSKLDQLLDRRVQDLLTYAERWSQKNPLLAMTAIDRLFALRPGNAKAILRLTKMGMPPPGRRISLFNGVDGTGWDYFDPPGWSVVDGVIYADTDGSMPMRHVGSFGGDFTVRVELRVIEDKGGASGMAILGASKSERQASCFGYLRRTFIWQENDPDREVSSSFNRAASDLPFTLDLREWTVLEMRFRPDRVEGVVNGRLLTSFPRRPERDSGYVAINVDRMKIAIRRIEVDQR